MDTKNTTITISVALDEQKMPEKIEWESTNNSHVHKEEAKASFVAFWDGKAQQALRIDLWTNDMKVDEMYLFYYQIMHSMADTLKRSTGNEEAALNLKAFANMFGENTEIVKKIEE